MTCRKIKMNNKILQLLFIALLGMGLVFGERNVMAESGLVSDMNMSAKEPKATINLQKRNKAMKERVKKAEEKRTERLKNRICARLDKMVARLKNAIDKRKSFTLKKFEERISRLQEKRNARDDALKKRREERDRYREKYYEELEKKAQTEEQKEAVKKFKETIENAVKKRRATIDQAVADMRSGIDAAIRERQAAIKSAVVSFENDEVVALNKAKNACDENADNEDLKNTMKEVREGIKIHRNRYKEQFHKVRKVGDVAEELAKTKRETIMNAIEEFKATVKSAQEELRKSFEETTDKQGNE